MEALPCTLQSSVVKCNAPAFLTVKKKNDRKHIFNVNYIFKSDIFLRTNTTIKEGKLSKSNTSCYNLFFEITQQHTMVI